MRRASLPILVMMVLVLGVGTAQAIPITYQAVLNGPSESPANASPGTGFAYITIDPDPTAHLMTVNATFSGLLGNTTASHIHCCTTTPLTGTAGVATTTPTFAGFPLGVTSGTYFNILDLTLASSWNPAYVTANGGSIAATEVAFETGIAAGRAYFNIHTSQFPGGEIRGFLVPAAVPEPTSMVLLGTGLMGLAARYRRRRG